MAVLVVALLVAALTAACSSPGKTSQAGTPQGTAPRTTPADTTPSSPPTQVPTAPRPTTTTRPNAAVSGWTVGPWQGAGRPVGGQPAVLTALLQPTTGGAAVGAAKLDSARLRVVLYAGTSEPGGAWTAQGTIASALLPSLVATFNSGFLLKSSRGGFYADGRAAPGAPLRDGAASLVVRPDGSATVGAWGRDSRLGADAIAVRQNLELLVDGGRPAPNVSTNVLPTWGYTLHSVIATWRSAVGVDGNGQLLYVGGPGLDPSGLAGAMIAVGAVRAMELDINPAWVSFNTFTDGPGGLSGTKLMAAMNPSASHFLSPQPRDFVAVFAR